MQLRPHIFWQQCATISLGVAIGVSVSYGAQPAVADGADAVTALTALSEQVARNSRRITELERQLRAVDGRVVAIDRRVASNTDATRVLSARSGIQIELRD